MAKPITFLDNDNTRKAIFDGINSLAVLVQTTLGPGGRPVLLEQEGKAPLSTKDGVTVARHFSPSGDVQRVVADAAREVCERTVRQVGDGTTTAITLAAAIVREGHAWLAQNPDYSPQRLSRELRETFTKVIRPEVLKLALPIKGLPADEAKEMLRKVALVSANHDQEIADAVADAIALVGDDGMVIAEEGAGIETKVEHKSGFPITTGLSDLGPAAGMAFVNQKSRGDCSLENAYVVLYDGNIENVETVAPILQKVMGEVVDGYHIKAPVLVVAHQFSDSVLQMMAKNFRQNVLTVVPLVTPRNGQSQYRQQFLYDLASYVSGRVFDPQGSTLAEANLAMLGVAEEIRVGANDTVILTEPDQEAVEVRMAELKEQMESVSEFDKDRIRYRLGQLSGGIATIYAGGMTALEAKERHARVVDAVSACRSALELGIVPGGGSTLVSVARILGGIPGPTEILAKAMRRPFIQILLNAGVTKTVEDALTAAEQVGSRDGEFVLYDALKRDYVSFKDSGIFDPAKVTITALENALSVSQLLMTLGGVVAIQMSDGEAQAKAMSDQLIKSVNNASFD